MMTDREFQWAMRYRVGSELLQQEDLAAACRCLVGKPLGTQLSLSHMSSCKYGGGAIKRHDTVLQQVNEMLRAVGMRTHLEPRARDDLRPAASFGMGAPDILDEARPLQRIIVLLVQVMKSHSVDTARQSVL